jgi:hypothetical protein
MLINPIIQSRTRYFRHATPPTRDNILKNNGPYRDFHVAGPFFENLGKRILHLWQSKVYYNICNSRSEARWIEISSYFIEMISC